MEVCIDYIKENYNNNTSITLEKKTIMKKILLVFIFSIFYNSLNAQTVNGIQIEDIPAKYIEVVTRHKTFKPFKITLLFDYGQIGNNKEVDKGFILDKDGNHIQFKGTIDALNFLEKMGYKYLNQHLEMAGTVRAMHTLLENTNYKK